MLTNHMWAHITFLLPLFGNPQKRSSVAACDECKKHYCTDCIDEPKLVEAMLL